MAQVVKLTGARVALDAAHTVRIDLQIRGGRILPFESRVTPSVEYDLSGHLILPGLINSHDHLEFNLFPRLGCGPWPNALDWSKDIYHPERSPVKEHRAVPRGARLSWGGIRNLVSGVTTVAHHNPWEARTFRRGFPVRVVKRFGWAHSLDHSPDLVSSRRKTPLGWPFIVHAAEGTDARARTEVTRLDELGVLDDATVLVHAAGATPRQLRQIRNRGASIVWCPTSNLFILGSTLPASAVRVSTGIALGTDSALTAEGDLIDEIVTARRVAGLTPEEIYPFVTRNAAQALRLDNGEGTIREGGVADFVAVKDTGQTPCQSLTDLRCELVLLGGRVMMMSERFASNADPGISRRGLYPIEVEARGRCLIRANVPHLHAAAARALGSDIRLAGKRVSQ